MERTGMQEKAFFDCDNFSAQKQKFAIRALFCPKLGGVVRSSKG